MVSNWNTLAIILIFSTGLFALGLYVASIGSTVETNKNTLSNFVHTFDARIKVSDIRNNLTQYKLNSALGNVTDLANDIREGTNIQLSQHTVHTDKELGDINGNLTRLIGITVKLLENRTPLFEDIIHNQRVLIANQYRFGQGLNVTGISNESR